MMRTTNSRGAGLHPKGAGELDVVVDFAMGLQDRGEFSLALEHLAELFGAEATLISRVGPSGTTSRRLAIFDREARRLLTPRNRPSLAGDILRESSDAAKPGVLWLMSEVLEPQKLRVFRDARRLEDWMIREVAVVPLCRQATGSDALELHFRSGFPEHCRPLILSLGQSIAHLWGDQIRRRRRPGLGGRDLREVRPRPAPRREILSSENPLDLTRCEFRVCLLVRSGHRVKEIADALAIQECTVRTHLRSIFAKTDVTSQIALLHLLLSKSESPDRYYQGKLA